MIIKIRGDKVLVTESIKDYVDQKIGKLSKYFVKQNEVNANVLIKVKGKNQSIEITIPTKNFTIRAEECCDDLYAAIDLVVEKVESQIRRNKTRIESKTNRDKIKEIDYNFDTELEDSNNNKIVKRKSIDMKPMSEEEAILQMNLLSHSFFIFKNVDSDSVSVLYQRKDGDYGIIELD